MLTNEEKTLVSNAASDIESGNHLLRKRTQQQIDMLNELCRTLKKHASHEQLTERERDILQQYEQCVEPHPNTTLME